MKCQCILEYHVLVLFISLWVCDAKSGRSHQGLIRRGELSERASSNLLLPSEVSSVCSDEEFGGIMGTPIREAARNLCKAFKEPKMGPDGKRWYAFPRKRDKDKDGQLITLGNGVPELSYDTIVGADIVMYLNEPHTTFTNALPPGTEGSDYPCPTGMVCPFVKQNRPMLEKAGESKAVLKPYGCGPQGMHTFVTHAYRCVGNTENAPTDEDLGCDLGGYTKRFDQAHWNLGTSFPIMEQVKCKLNHKQEVQKAYCAQKSCTVFCGDTTDTKDSTERGQCRLHGGSASAGAKCFVREASAGFECACPVSQDEIQGDHGEADFVCKEVNFEKKDKRTYNIPDYCSRAMVAELSQIYDGDRRRAETWKGFKHLGSDIGPVCGENDLEDSDEIKSLFVNNAEGMACWGFSDSYKKLYCSVYAKCESTHENPNLDNKSINCCRNEWAGRTQRYKDNELFTYMKSLPRYISQWNEQKFKSLYS